MGRHWPNRSTGHGSGDPRGPGKSKPQWLTGPVATASLLGMRTPTSRLARSFIAGSAMVLALGVSACGDDDGADVRDIGEEDGGSGSGAGSGSGSGSGSGTPSGTPSG